MDSKSLDDLLSQYRNEVLGEKSREGQEMARFLGFLLSHGGLKKLEIPGKTGRLLEQVERLPFVRRYSGGIGVKRCISWGNPLSEQSRNPHDPWPTAFR